MNIKPVRTISIEELEKENPIIQDKPIEKKDIDLKQAKKDNRYYLPVLHINNTEYWESKPKSERKHFTDEVAKETCLSNCCGIPGLKSACCRLDTNDLEHVLGTVSEKWIRKTLKWFKNKGINYVREDLVIDFEEGKIIGENFFNGHRAFMEPKSYPMLRYRVDGGRWSCQWLSPSSGLCTIYPIRPGSGDTPSNKTGMCGSYLCKYVLKNFLVKTRDKPNTWQMIE